MKHNHDTPPFSPALVLAFIRDHEPVTFRETAQHWVGPFPFEAALGLLCYGLVAIHYHGGLARVVVTSRGATFSYNRWDDGEIVEACRRLRMETAGSMVMS